MNVTVMVPKSLRPSVEGKVKVNLGLPPSANVGDLLEALFTLYPKLKQHVASDKNAKANHLTLFAADSPFKDGPRWRIGLREGQTLYLSAAQPKRLAS